MAKLAEVSPIPEQRVVYRGQVSSAMRLCTRYAKPALTVTFNVRSASDSTACGSRSASTKATRRVRCPPTIITLRACYAMSGTEVGRVLVPGVRGGVELAFLSTTANVEVAVGYAEGGDMPTVFRIETGSNSPYVDMDMDMDMDMIVDRETVVCAG
eukprot:1218897-Rhodomonas_salina.3